MEYESMNGHIDDLLAEGDERSMQAAAEHAVNCAACAEMLTAFNDMSTTARSLHATWKSDMLLPRIQRAVREERKQTSWRRHTWQIAAAVALTVGMGGGAWHVMRVRADDAAFNRRILQDAALERVQQAEKAHVDAINELQKVAGPQLEEPQTPLMVSYKEKLVILDEAIADCEQNIERNRQNAHLRGQLLAMYTEKQKTLQDVIREGSNVSKQ